MPKLVVSWEERARAKAFRFKGGKDTYQNLYFQGRKGHVPKLVVSREERARAKVSSFKGREVSCFPKPSTFYLKRKTFQTLPQDDFVFLFRHEKCLISETQMFRSKEEMMSASLKFWVVLTVSQEPTSQMLSVKLLLRALRVLLSSSSAAEGTPAGQVVGVKVKRFHSILIDISDIPDRRALFFLAMSLEV